MTQSAIEILDISHNFGGIQVLSALNFKVTDGAIVGLLGPNGSGKSTLFNVLSGFIKPAKGDALLFGRPLNALSVEQRCAHGMLRTFQTPKLFENMTVLENLMAGAYNVLPMDGPAYRMWARLMHTRSDTLYEDAMIAATARIHNLTVVTRNVADFAGFDVAVLNPFKSRGA